mmetsp:Transcript_28935/g.46389  ORF Transcript_28935/g.46389 Transcript_28935/m.46389 type:complete len:80 (+) Transcript_28935:11-250(+)
MESRWRAEREDDNSYLSTKAQGSGRVGFKPGEGGVSLRFASSRFRACMRWRLVTPTRKVLRVGAKLRAGEVALVRSTSI